MDTEWMETHWTIHHRSLSNNQIIGSLPEWSHLTDLVTMWETYCFLLGRNEKTCYERSTHRWTLPCRHLHKNQIRGSLPEWSNLTNLETMSVHATGKNESPSLTEWIESCHLTRSAALFQNGSIWKDSLECKRSNHFQLQMANASLNRVIMWETNMNSLINCLQEFGKQPDQWNPSRMAKSKASTWDVSTRKSKPQNVWITHEWSKVLE